MSNFRMMTAMVLFRFEQELGKFISQRSSNFEEIVDLANGITRRETVKRPGLEISTTSQLISESYLEDLFQISIKTTEHSSDQANVIALKSLCSALSLNEIRNAVCHPNRPFPECYWYRVAAIASDPLVQKLEFNALSSTLESAIAGQLDTPPDNWITLPEWLVSNNLPASNDFEITGLIGRPNETKELEKLLANQRVTNIAIVAPGGVGKTALTLDVLEKACKTPEFRNIFDGVAFLSLKLEKLTAQGVQKIDAPTSIKQIEDELLRIIPLISNDECEINTFLELKEKYSSQKLLLFIDNLETLLRDNPNEFNEFQFSLPAAWRVLVTSRITINSSTCLSIAPLQDKNAKHLTRLYALRRNASGLINDAAIDKIVQRTRCNPLAIRLGVDAYVLGSPLDDSLNLAARDVLSFSYKNLLEVISKESRAILECLFIQDPQSRIELAENLGASIDTIATGLGELSRTSLILRNNEDREEMYSLYPSIRDLLLINPLDPVSREKVQDIIFKRRESIVGNDHRQIRRSRFHTDYVDSELPVVVREICFETNDTVWQLHKKKTPEQALRLLERLRRLKSEFPSITIIPRCIAKLHAKLGDSGTAFTELSHAIAIDPNDIRLLQELARLAHDAHKYDIAFQYYDQIKQQVGWDIQKTDENTVRYCLNGYLIALLYSGKNEKILEETHDWDANPITKDIMGVFRARAWKRSIENNGNLDEKTHGLKKAANILTEISKLYGHTRQTNGSFREVIEEIANCVDTPGFASLKETLQLLDFSENHITNVFQDLGDDLENVLLFVSKFRSVNIIGNPFKNTQWNEFLHSKGGKIYVDAEFKDDLKQGDYTFVKVYHIPKTGSAFVFAKDDSGKEYFIHSDIVGHLSRRDWNRLVQGVEMAIKTDGPAPLHGKAHAAIEAHILSS